jgi:hypothetical protein
LIQGPRQARNIDSRYRSGGFDYRTSLTKNQLEKAPKYNQSTSWNWNRDNDLRVYDYYKTQPYWSAV